MNNISGYQTNDKSLSGVITISDGGGTIISNGEIDCKSLFVDGVQIVGSNSATVNVGTTATLSAGSNATVVNVGNSTNAILNFGIPQGVQGEQGDTGEGFTYLGNFNAYYQYYRNDVVYYNGSSYACIVASYGNYPTNTSYWGMIAKEGDVGPKGNTGEKGDKGDTGNRGPEGPKGDDGASVDVGAIIVGVISAVGFAAVETQVAALQTEVGILTASVAVVEDNVIILQNKTQNQTAVLESTSFVGDVNVTNGVSNKITLSKQGNIDCVNLQASGSITTTDGIETNGSITCDSGHITINDGNFLINNTVSTTAVNPVVSIDTNGNLSIQGELKLNNGLVNAITMSSSTGTVDCNNVIVSQTTTTPTLQVSNINSNGLLNTINIGSALGIVNINGIVNMPQMNAFWGFNVQNGFINQF